MGRNAHVFVFKNHSGFRHAKRHGVGPRTLAGRIDSAQKGLKPPRTNQGQGFGAPLKRPRRKQAGQAKNVIPVKVANQDHVKGGAAQAHLANADLGPLAAVKEH